MNSLYGYIRVSTARQGVRGVSLQEQREAIERFATRNGMTISQWFEERETAAKRGRPVWNEMLRLLRRREASGVVIHKIDRSARNLRDWSDLQDLVDRGTSEVYFANDSVDLHTRGGRLSADIQAVVAADYVRNLREEAKKGIYGRLKQGIYPLPAPVGYLDRGAGKPKDIDPVKGPLVRQAFELYSSGRYTFMALREEMSRRGLRTRSGKPISLNGFSTLLNNPFYIGLIRIRRTGDTYPGAHTPLITKRLFDRVHNVLYGKTNTRLQKHTFTLRRLLKCRSCGYSLIGEERKGFRYYRCHTRTCARVCLREEAVASAVMEKLADLEFTPIESEVIRQKLEELRAAWLEEAKRRKDQVRLELGLLQTRLAGLTDAMLDGLIDRDLFLERKQALLLKDRSLKDQLATIERTPEAGYQKLKENIGLAEGAPTLYETASEDEKREILLELTSDRQVDGKSVAITLAPGYDLIAERHKISDGGPYRDTHRTWESLMPNLIDAWLLPSKEVKTYTEEDLAEWTSDTDSE